MRKLHYVATIVYLSSPLLGIAISFSVNVELPLRRLPLLIGLHELAALASALAVLSVKVVGTISR